MEVFSLQGSVNLRDQTTEGLRRVQSEAQNTESKLSSFSSKVNSIGQGMADFGTKMSAKVSLPIIGLGVASAKLASDFNESLNKVNVAFGNSASQVEDWSKTTLKNFGIAQGTALDMSSLFGDMATSMGLPTDEAGKMSMSMVGLAGDLASFKNIGIDQATTALNGVFTGETESLKMLGIVMTQTNLQAFAYSNGINKNIQDMSQAEQVQLRYAYVMDKTKNAQGDFARTSDGTANSTRSFGESLKQLGATFGQNILPVVTPVIQKLTDMVTWFGNLDSGTQKTIVTVLALVAGIFPLIGMVGSLITSVTSIVRVFSLASTAITGASGATTALGGVFAFITSPIGIVVAAIAGIIAIFVLAYKNSEDFRTKVNTVFEQVKTIISGVIENIKTIFSIFVQVAMEIWNKYGNDIMAVITNTFTFISNIITTALNIISNIIKIATGIISGDWSMVWEGIKGVISSVWNGIGSIISSGIDLLKSIISTGLEIAWDIVKRVFNGIKEAIMSPIRGAVDFVGEQVQKIKNFFSNLSIKFPHIPLPHFSISGSINPLKWLEEGVPRIGVDWYAKGAIFTQPTILGGIGVGDKNNGIGSNAEAVLPINELGRILKEQGIVGDNQPKQYFLVLPDGRVLAELVAENQDVVDRYNERDLGGVF